MERRIAGILLHPTSLPGEGGLGPEAYRFVDFLAAAGCSAWQMLPPGPVGPGNSPYASRSAFAGEPLLISLEMLARDGLLDPRTDFWPPSAPLHRMDFEALRQHREPLLRYACAGFLERGGRDALDDMFSRHAWLASYVRFSALRELSEQPWWEWPDRFREETGVPTERGTSLRDEIDFQAFLQFCIERQWRELRRYAHERGIALYGDVPIFVDIDSADVWARKEFFELDDDGRPRAVAGVPPDAFSATGQRWGNPLYNWNALRDDGYSWWIERMRRTFTMFDAVRIDHFRGFESAWEIPAYAEHALEGRWVPGPGRALFDALGAAIGELPIIVEDLGMITPEVRALRESLGYPGMAVLHFAFTTDDSNEYLPHNHRKNQVVFTGTHDNDTTRGWYQHAPEWEREWVRRYLSIDGEYIADDLVRCAYRSIANTALIPMQDVLALGSEGRMNVPGTAHGNWGWRFSWDQLWPGRTEWLAQLASDTGRNRQLGYRDA